MNEEMPLENKTFYICPKCGADNDSDAKFCTQCGEKMQRPIHKVCGKCKIIYPTSEQFCKKCGSPLKAKFNVKRISIKIPAWLDKVLVAAMALILLYCLFCPCLRINTTRGDYYTGIFNAYIMVLRGQVTFGLKDFVPVFVAEILFTILLCIYAAYRFLSKKEKSIARTVISWVVLVLSPVIMFFIYYKIFDIQHTYNLASYYFPRWEYPFIGVIVMMLINIVLSLTLKVINKFQSK